jgi:hypothetical protein
MEKIMKKYRLLIVIAAFIIAACAPKTDSKKVVLFNGTDFTGWTLFIPGDSVDVKNVWSVRDGVVLCAGVPNGYMRTNETYSNYNLHLEWRWLETPTNSGVLLNCQPPDQVWPNCIENQLMAGNAGDLVLIGPGQITVSDSNYINPGTFVIIKKKHDSNEKPTGEWNTYDIEVHGSSISSNVNGLLQNSGTNAALSSGFIGLQSEGSPIEFRNIYLVLIK